MILAGDVGGTKAVLALFEEAGDALCLVREATFRSREHKNFESILDAFLEKVVPIIYTVAASVFPGPCSTARPRRPISPGCSTSARWRTVSARPACA